MTPASALADISVLQLLAVAGTALFASVIGGVAGYGTGALMPLVLVPIVGAEPVVPIIAISALFSTLQSGARLPPDGRPPARADRDRRLAGSLPRQGAGRRMPIHLHAAILDAVVLCGGGFLVIGALTR